MFLKLGLKGQCHEIFCFWFFSWISFPPAPEYSIMTVSNFFENSRRYSQVKVHHRWQISHWCQFATGINDTGGKFCHQLPLCCWHRWQICHRCQRYRRQICQRCRWQIATGINYTRSKFATGVIDTGGKQWEQYQAADTWKWTWRQKFIYMFPLLPKGDQTKLLKFFWLKIFSIFSNLELRISPRIFEKIRNGLNGILWGWGETDLWKEPEAKNLVTLSL